MTKEEEDKIQDAYLKRAVELRGSIIHEHTFMEKVLQSYIASHFCDTTEKASEFFEWVICPLIPFDKTREIFVNIFKNNYPDLLEKYKTELKYISDINEERNIVAHYIINTTTEGLKRFVENNEIGFVKFKNKTTVQIFDLQRLVIFGTKMNAIRKMFTELKIMDDTFKTP